MKRYGWEMCLGFYRMVPQDDGKWVLYEDVQELQGELNRLRRMKENVPFDVDDLAGKIAQKIMATKISYDGFTWVGSFSGGDIHGNKVG